MSHPTIHARRDTIAKSLEGTWRTDLVFVLQQEVTMYDAYLQRIDECDKALEQHLKSLAGTTAETPDATAVSPDAQPRLKRRRKAGSHTPQFNLGRELHRISGVDLTRIDGIDVSVAQTVISEVGLDMARWPNEHHFASLVYRMLRWGRQYVDKAMQYYEERHREQQIRRLTKRAAKLGLVIVSSPQAS